MIVIFYYPHGDPDIEKLKSNVGVVPLKTFATTITVLPVRLEIQSFITLLTQQVLSSLQSYKMYGILIGYTSYTNCVILESYLKWTMFAVYYSCFDYFLFYNAVLLSFPFIECSSNVC